MRNLLIISSLLFAGLVFGRTAYQSNTMPPTGNLPGWGPVYLNQPNAVASVLPVTHGGTGQSAIPLGGMLIGGPSGTPSVVPIGSAGQVWTVTTGPSPTAGWNTSGVLSNPMTGQYQMVVGGPSGVPSALPSGGLEGNTNFLKAPIIQTYTNTGVTTTGTTSTSSNCLSALGTTTGIYVGMGVLDSTHSALQEGTSVVGIPGTCPSLQIQINQTPTLSETGDTLVFGAMETTTGTISTSTVCITSLGTTINGIPVGAPVIDITHPTALSSSIVVVGLPGTCSGSNVQISAVANISETGDTLAFGQVFTTPSSALYFTVEEIGAGGGGGGLTSGAGTAGLLSTFGNGLLSCPGGGGANFGSSVGIGGRGTGAGFCTVGSGISQVLSLQGGNGQGGGWCANNPCTGYPGCTSPFGMTPTASSGISPGSGGGGADFTSNSASGWLGPGGACGSYFKGAVLSGLAASYPFYVGNGGNAGTNARAGAGGVLITTTYSQ